MVGGAFDVLGGESKPPYKTNLIVVLADAQGIVILQAVFALNAFTVHIHLWPGRSASAPAASPLGRQHAMLRRELAIRDAQIALSCIAADDKAALHHAGPAALGDGGPLAPEQRDQRRGRASGSPPRPTGVRPSFSAARSRRRAHRTSAEQRQQQHSGQQQRHPEPRKIKFLSRGQTTTLNVAVCRLLLTLAALILLETRFSATVYSPLYSGSISSVACGHPRQFLPI